MSQIPAPVLSRQVGGVVLVLSAVAAVALSVAPFVGTILGWGWIVAAVVLTAIQQAYLALAIALIGRSGLAGRHGVLPVLATLGSAGILLLDALAEVLGVVLVFSGVLPTDLVTPVALALGALTAALLLAFGVAVLRASVVHPAARILPLVAGLGVVAAGIAVALAPLVGTMFGPPVAVLLSGGIALALFTPRTLQ